MLKPDLNTNIRTLRVLRGFTQTELGRRAKLSGQYISMLERGLQPSHADHIDKIAAALGVSRDALLNGDVRARLLPLVAGR